MALADALTRLLIAIYTRGQVFRSIVQALWDALSWTLAFQGARILLNEIQFSSGIVLESLMLGLLAGGLQTLIGTLLYLYRGRHPYGSFAEVWALLLSAFLVFVIVQIATLLLRESISISGALPIIAFMIALALMCSIRYLKRLLLERRQTKMGDAQRTIVFGAGHLGAQIIRRMLTDAESPYYPVALLDDDAARRHRELDGVRVLGTSRDLEDVVRRTGATTVIVAIARADSALLTRVSESATAAGIAVKVLPTLDQIIDGKSRIADVRDISIEDIIGRHIVDTEVGSVAGYLAGRRVLVTGAGGSIGAELCRQINRYGPAELIMLDRDETALQGVQLTLTGQGLLDTPDVVLADIRDSEALAKIFTERRPEIVFHAAALKHLPLLEQYPAEAWKSNVVGTANVLGAAMSADVEIFINISTDKAAQPTSVLGHSKRVAERLTAWAGKATGRTFVSVRFGNVLGSRGSMLPTFASMIESGGPVTVTHPDATRYFMTIPEACQLVIHAGGIAEAGEVLILAMGQPVRILDVAQKMIAMSGTDVPIVFTGLRQGEKLHEELEGIDEKLDFRVHPKIAHTQVAPLSPQQLDQQEWLERLDESRRDTDLVEPRG